MKPITALKGFIDSLVGCIADDSPSGENPKRIGSLTLSSKNKSAEYKKYHTELLPNNVSDWAF